MKTYRFLFFSTLTVVLAILLNTKFDKYPPFGKFLSPFRGFWQNAETKDGCLHFDSKIKGLKDEVLVKLDEQRVPHIFAKNEHDLYFMQGYVTARDRLWQMEFMALGASGRVSEIFGENEQVLEYDRTIRRIGIPYAAKNAIEQIDSDPIANSVLTSYTEGVNAYINSLSEKNLPLEYKLLDYKPARWTPYKCALLLKYMSNMLTGKEYDFEYTNALKFLDKATFDLLYPDFPEGIDPIVPVGTPFSKSQISVSSINPSQSRDASIRPLSQMHSASVQRGNSESSSTVTFEEPSPANGSNNWAVAGSKSTTGRPILCSDPHLGLRLPSIWYMQQLHAPGLNVLGVTIPGAPGITIGFNEKIAWGVTNAERDVKDWYKVEFKDNGKNEYKLDGKWVPTKKIVEEIKVRGEKIFYDTIIYTHHGPVSYDDNFKKYDNPYPVALRWTAHDQSNELKAFYFLNRAQNYDDYISALNYYECPGQNFAFACTDGDIAIKEQGKFILQNIDDGKFIQDGTVSSTDWKGFIPFEDNPTVRNPARGFISSANQHPTDSTYPYYYHGIYEYYRNRRINTVLSEKEKFSPQELMQLQNDNFNMMAAEVLPYLLTMIDPASLNDAEGKAFTELASWNFFNNKDLIAPSYFTAFWKILYESLWDEFYPEDEKGLAAPDYYSTVGFLINNPTHPLADNKQTQENETIKELVPKAFKEAVTELVAWSDSTGKNLDWATYKGTRFAHWLPIEAFYQKNIAIGGNEHIVNACSKTHGPSWRMIVALGEPVQAWGIYPGGQSGNPGSPYYVNFGEMWANGEYHQLVFLKDTSETNDKIILTKTIQP